MSRPRRAAADVRLFVAAYPPREAVERMLEAAAGLELAAHRVTPAEQVHLTLCFIGDTPGREVEAVRESVARSAAGVPAFELTPRRLVTLPERGRPRLVAMETDSPPAMLEVVRRLVMRLARRVRQRPAEGFLPHLTLLRYQHTASPGRVGAAVEMPAFAIDRVALVRSVLTSAGAVHTPVEEFPLGQ